MKQESAVLQGKIAVITGGSKGIGRSIALSLATADIRVNSVAPGATNTDMNRHFTPEVLAKLEARIPLGRVGDSDDIGDVVSFLVSDYARYITGATIVVDGGFIHPCLLRLGIASLIAEIKQTGYEIRHQNFQSYNP